MIKWLAVVGVVFSTGAQMACGTVKRKNNWNIREANSTGPPNCLHQTMKPMNVIYKQHTTNLAISVVRLPVKHTEER